MLYNTGNFVPPEPPERTEPPFPGNYLVVSAGIPANQDRLEQPLDVNAVGEVFNLILVEIGARLAGIGLYRVAVDLQDFLPVAGIRCLFVLFDKGYQGGETAAEYPVAEPFYPFSITSLAKFK